MNEARPLQSVSDKSDVSDPFGILRLFQSDPTIDRSDASDRSAAARPTCPTGPGASRTENSVAKQSRPTGPTCPTDSDDGATAALPIRCAPNDRAEGLEPDAGAYLDFLNLHGPHTYGAAASTLGWGATRAWRAEAKLRALGLVHYCEGKAVPTEGGQP